MVITSQLKETQSTEKHDFLQLKVTKFSMVLMAFVSPQTPTAARLGTERSALLYVTPSQMSYGEIDQRQDFVPRRLRYCEARLIDPMSRSFREVATPCQYI